MALDVVGKLKLMRMKSPEARALFDCLLKYANFMRSMPVSMLAGKSGLSEREVRDVLKVLERLKLGRLWLGRRKDVTRFEWAENYLDFVPAKQLGEPETLDPLDALNVKGVGGATSSPLNEWVISLGGRRQAQLLLPALIKREDVLRVREFCDQYLKALKGAA